MGPRPGWCHSPQVWDSQQNLCLPEGSGTGEGTTETQPQCDCANTAYEHGHACYTQCGGTEPGGGGGDDHAWYLREIKSKPNQYDTGISEGQWIAWRSFWDDATKSFRSENVDNQGNSIGGTGFNKPVDCPDGTTKFNVNQCLPLDDRRVGGSGTQPVGGTGTGGTGRGTGSGGSDVKASGGAVSQLPYTGVELHDILANFFNYRSGIFGTGDPALGSATPRTPKGEEIKAFDLPKGGVWWGEAKSLESALAPFGNLFDSSKQSTGTGVTPSAVQTPVKPAVQTCSAGFTWNASMGSCMPEVHGGPAQPVVPFTGPLEAALSRTRQVF